jgi:hypothetical protein
VKKTYRIANVAHDTHLESISDSREFNPPAKPAMPAALPARVRDHDSRDLHPLIRVRLMSLRALLLKSRLTQRADTRLRRRGAPS